MMNTPDTYKHWNIKGIAESILKQMREDFNGDPDTRKDYESFEDFRDDVILDYLNDNGWSVYSRSSNHGEASTVMGMVEEYINEMMEVLRGE